MRRRRTPKTEAEVAEVINRALARGLEEVRRSSRLWFLRAFREWRRTRSSPALERVILAWRVERGR